MDSDKLAAAGQIAIAVIAALVIKNGPFSVSIADVLATPSPAIVEFAESADGLAIKIDIARDLKAVGVEG